MRTRLFVSVFIILGLVTSACARSSGPKIEVQDTWARPVAMVDVAAAQTTPESGSAMGNVEAMGPMGVTSAAYMLISNTGSEADRLLSASSDAAAATEIHLSEMKEGVMTMRPVEGGIEIPAGGQVELKPGGYHVMLIGLKHELAPGGKVQLTLTFEKSGQMAVEAQIRNP